MAQPEKKIASLLSGYGTIVMDTMMFIYEFQAHPRYGLFTRPFFRLLSGGKIRALTTTITLAELLVHAYSQGEARTAKIYRSRIANYPNLTLRPISSDLADRAAELRAKYKLPLPDCLQMSPAGDRDVFLTNDGDLSIVEKEIPVLLIDDIMQRFELGG